MGTSPVSAASPTITVSAYVGLWARFWAMFIDGLILYIVLFPILHKIFPADAVIDSSASSVGTSISGTAGIVFYILYCLYFIVLTYLWGATLGKKILGIKVAKADSTQLTVGAVILRETVGRVVCAISLGIGYLWVAFNPKKQGWHDLIAGTIVLRVKA